MAGKGDKRRPQQISSYENDLRWELMSSKTTQERKCAIIQELEEIKHQKLSAPVGTKKTNTREVLNGFFEELTGG